MSDEETQATATTEGSAEVIPTETAAAATDLSDYDRRIETDPAFAKAELKKFQAAKDRLENEMKTRLGKFSSLEPWVDNLGGADAVLSHLSRLGAAMANPKMRETLEAWERTGSVPGLGATDSGVDATEEYLDPTEREVRSVKAELAALKEQLSRGQSRQAQDGIKQNLNKLFEEHPYLTEEERTQIVSKIDGQIRQWDATEEGRRLIASINYDSLKIVAAPVILSKLEEIGERAYLRKQQQKAKAATEVAAPRQTNGKEMSPQAKNASQALREFMRQNNLSDFSPDMGRR